MDNTSQKIDTLISGFKSVVRHLLDQGFDVNRAIEEAYKRYPVIDSMKESIVDDMIKSFTSGYMNASVEVGVDTRDIPYSSEAISTAMQRTWSKDNLNLSTRLHKRGQAVRKEVADILKATIGKGNTNKKIASELLNRGVIDTAGLPKFMKEVAQIPISMSADKKRKLLRNVHRQVSKRTTAGIRAAYNEVINAVNNDNQEKLDKAIEIATEEKTRYNAERIARTEIARAYADGQVSRCIDDDDIVAFQWKLGSRHPVFDICDFYANADLYGMGKGVFPKDKVPMLPAHPHCMCRLKPIVAGMIDNSTPKKNINNGGMDLLKSLSVKEQERLLGVHGRVAVLDGKARWQDHLRGWNNGKFEVRIPKINYKKLKEGVKGVKVKRNNVIDIAQMDETLLKNSDFKLLTKNLVLTDKSINHIKERHPNDYKDVIKDISNMVQSPDSIMIGNKPHTLIYMTRNSRGHMYQVVIRLRDEGMSDEFQNSIITLNRVNEKRYKRYKKSREFIYKKEESDV
ncbi:hypothetical protein [Veillonella montpellierensis]|uniref:hypothetical protein n=1 Tax=Veillonella montpellierensis TaxID=187328 RepID=UPI0023F9513D|nr:hypothetical protein [Veillonella montpellierensis]